MINGVLRLADRSVRSVMTPRVEVVWIDLDDPPETIRREISESGHSRYPAGRKGLDELEGIIHTKHLFDQVARTGRFDIAASLRQPLVVHEATPVLGLLEMFRAEPGAHGRGGRRIWRAGRDRHADRHPHRDRRRAAGGHDGPRGGRPPSAARTARG